MFCCPRTPKASSDHAPLPRATNPCPRVKNAIFNAARERVNYLSHCSIRNYTTSLSESSLNSNTINFSRNASALGPLPNRILILCPCTSILGVVSSAGYAAACVHCVPQGTIVLRSSCNMCSLRVLPWTLPLYCARHYFLPTSQKCNPGPCWLRFWDDELIMKQLHSISWRNAINSLYVQQCWPSLSQILYAYPPSWLSTHNTRTCRHT